MTLGLMNRSVERRPAQTKTGRFFRKALLGLSLVLLMLVGNGPAQANDVVLPERLHGLDGRLIPLAPAEEGVTALILYSTECPIANYYAPVLGEVAATFGDRLKLVGICVDEDLTNGEIEEHARQYSLPFPIVCDDYGRIGKILGATTTPEAFVFDSTGTLRYQGRIDDQWASRRVRNRSSKTDDLRVAISAVLAGDTVELAYAEPVGCPLPTPRPTPTYSDQIATLLQKNCQECHQKGAIGPFALDDYSDARKRADLLAYEVEHRRMPPWFPEPGFNPPFQHDRGLDGRQIATLLAWTEAGAPEGEPRADRTSATRSDQVASTADEWQLGTPDLIIEMDEPFEIPATGEDIYRCFVLPTDLPRDVFVSAIEYQPGNPRVVHHIIGYIDVKGEARKRDQAEPGQGYTCFGGPQVEVIGDVGGWAPGAQPDVMAEGVGVWLPKGADIVMQVHYHPSGKSETDRSRIGLYLAPKPVRKIRETFAITPKDDRGRVKLDLPANQENIEVTARFEVPVEATILDVIPHMHLLGQDLTMTVTFPDGRTQGLIRVPQWDFNWQLQYKYQVPLTIPAGSVIDLVAHFDNSSANPWNPNDPPQDVSWGEATTDEMCIGFLRMVSPDQDLTQGQRKGLYQRIADHERDR